MFLAPPRHYKTQQNTISYVAYRVIRDPGLRVIVGAHTQNLARKISRFQRKLAQPQIALNPTKQAADEWETMYDGGVRAVGVGVAVAGTGGQLIVIDDPVRSRADAESLTYRDKLWDWYTDDILTRRENPATCQMLLTMTQWSEDDIAGRIMNSDEAKNWLVVRLPAIAEDNDPLGRKEGEPLCPEIIDIDELQRLRILTPGFEALYQARPSAKEGNLFKREWWRYLSVVPPLRRIIQSWDTAFKTKQKNDYSVCTTIGEFDRGYIIIDVFRDKLESPELKQAMASLYRKWQPEAVYVEDAASGQSMIQELQRVEAGMPKIPIIPVPTKSVLDYKFQRAQSVAPMIQAGHVYLLDGTDWLHDFVTEYASFPNGANDDQVDSGCQGLDQLIHKIKTTLAFAAA